MATTVADGPRRREGNPIEILVITMLLIGGLLYGVIALSSGNPLWFTSSAFGARATNIELYHQGERTLLRPGNPHYEAITASLNEQLNQISGYYEQSPRATTVEEAKERGTVLVLSYPETLRFNTAWNLGEPNQILIPVAGSLSNQNLVFTGTDGRYGHGGLVLEDLNGVYAAVDRVIEE